MKLSEQDIKLLEYLYHSSRESISKIAKETKLSREQVNYKLEKFKKEGLIKKFITIYNYPAMGYNLWTILLLKTNKELNLKEIKNISLSTKVIGKYDQVITLLSKNQGDLQEIIFQIKKENIGSIKELKIITPYFTEMYPLKFLNNNKTFRLIEQTNKQNLKKDEIKILKIIEKDARIKITEIANKLNISAELALYKLRNLQKKKIILGTKVNFDITKLGYHYSMISITTNNLSHQTEDKIKELIKKDKFANSLILSINEPQIMIQIFNKTQDELTGSIKKIKSILKDEIKNLDIMFIEQEKDFASLPKLD